ncbi:hypothetical protein TrRE_jg11298, partial [Triparma retinervis]
GENEESSLASQPALPPGWVSRISKTHNRIFYFHEDHGSSWIRPTAHVVKRVVAEYALKNKDFQSVSSLSHSSYGSSVNNSDTNPAEKEPEAAVAAKVVESKSSAPDPRKAKPKPVSKPKPKPVSKPKTKAKPKLKPSPPARKKRASTNPLPDRPKRRRVVKKGTLKSKNPADGANDESFDFGNFEDGSGGDSSLDENVQKEPGNDLEASDELFGGSSDSSSDEGASGKVKGTKAKSTVRPPLSGAPALGVFGQLPVPSSRPTPLGSIAQYHKLVAKNRRRERRLALERVPTQTLLHPKACGFKAVYRGGFTQGCTLQALVTDR